MQNFIAIGSGVSHPKIRDFAVPFASFKRQLKTFHFALYQTQRIERIRDAMTMRYINLLFIYLLTYLLFSFFLRLLYNLHP